MHNAHAPEPKGRKKAAVNRVERVNWDCFHCISPIANTPPGIMCTQLASTGNGLVCHLICYQCFLARELPVDYRDLTIIEGLSQIETVSALASMRVIATSRNRLVPRD